MHIKIVNNYVPPVPTAPSAGVEEEDLLHAGETYDVNFVFPVKPLESDKLSLVPFIPALHLPLFQEHTAPYPEMFAYLPFGPFPTVSSAASLYLKRVQNDPSSTWYCVVDKTRPPSPGSAGLGGAFAGIIGLLAASRAQSQAELGYLLIPPPFQRTHVTTHACALLLRYVLDPPALGGLGLRRAQWKANAMNERSVRAAERLGFRREALLRWAMVLPKGKEGLEPPGWEEGREGEGRHTVLLGLCWDDWEEGGREHVQALMSRVQ
ncbi:hypothetical protein CALVIDRAFT_478699 [Calocera viscosa TUFC12733]|uniref:N-acetyltransferase domain-containing protein n=1 Tax=Calocera viscosa (strain TUFC12733) TaxID=1330018 RepID=A0A167NY96_CALVF|nr:hypothetical protein CALVIDRAFT_478699 [Calocera viscosa TUFC12733]